MTLCLDCPTELSPRTEYPGRPRSLCVPCAKARRYAYVKAWRARNPDAVRNTARQQSRRTGVVPHGQLVAQKRAKMLERAKPILDLLAKDYSYAQAASVIGVSKNTAIGLVDRVRKMEARA